MVAPLPMQIIKASVVALFEYPFKIQCPKTIVVQYL